MKYAWVSIVVLLVPATALADDYEVGLSFGYSDGERGSAIGQYDTATTSASPGVFTASAAHAGTAAWFDGGPTARLFGGYRFMNGLLAIGLSGSGRLTTTAIHGVDYDPRLGLSFGPYIRLYPTHTRVLEPWVSVGLEYAVERLTYRVPRYDELHLTHHGLAIPLAIGLDFRINSLFAFGPSLQVMHVRPLAACYDGPRAQGNIDPNVATRQPEDDCSGNWQLKAEAYTTWSASLGVRFSL